MTRKKTPFTRRDFIKSSVAGIALPFVGRAATNPTVTSPPEQSNFLLKDATVLTMDDEAGDFEKADILIEGELITEVGPTIGSTAEVVDASNYIIIPGFVDTHRHMWQGVLKKYFT